MQFSQTKIYRKTMDLINLSQIILRDLPCGYGFLADQLRRAAASIPLNFAEGINNFSAVVTEENF